MRNILNFIAFQLVWFIALLTAAKGTSLYALAATGLFVMLQLAFSHCRLADIKLLLSGLVIGMLLDSIWLNLAWIEYAVDQQTGLAPWWIGCLWVNFMMTLNHSLSWLQNRRTVLVVCTLFAAPLSYYAGSELGAVTLIELWPALVALSLSWAVLVPIFMALAKHWVQQEKETQHALV